MRKKGKTLFMLALCCTLLGSNSMVYATSKGVSEDQAKATSTSTKVEKPDFLFSFEDVENSDDYIGTTQELADTGESVAMFNSKYSYLIIGEEGGSYYIVTEDGKQILTSAKDIKTAEFDEVSSDYGFTSKSFSYKDSFSVLVKDGKTLVSSTPAVRNNTTIANNIVIAPGQTATFQINYEFVEIGEPQDYDQGRNYSSTVEIEIVSAN